MDGLILRSPQDNPVYAFMDKKRAEGKPYYVYMTAGANKFLRILREGERLPFIKGGCRGRGGRIRFLTASRFLHRPALRGGLFAVHTIP